MLCLSVTLYILGELYNLILYRTKSIREEVCLDYRTKSILLIKSVFCSIQRFESRQGATYRQGIQSFCQTRKRVFVKLTLQILRNVNTNPIAIKQTHFNLTGISVSPLLVPIFNYLTYLYSRKNFTRNLGF